MDAKTRGDNDSGGLQEVDSVDGEKKEEYSEVRLDDEQQTDDDHHHQPEDEARNEPVIENDDCEPQVTIHSLNSKNGNTMCEEMKSNSGSSASSPGPNSPRVVHRTRFQVTVSHAKECTGDIITYRVTSKRLFDESSIEPSSCSSDGQQQQHQQHKQSSMNETREVLRVYEDFEFLHQCLVMAAFAGDGLIVVPLPTKLLGSNIDPVYEQLIRQSARHSSSNSSQNNNPFINSMIDPCFRKDCHMLQQYVNLMLAHPTFGRNLDVWDKFLLSEKPAARIKVGNKKSSSNFSFISKLMDGSNVSSGSSVTSSGSVSACAVPGSPRLTVTNSSATLTPSVIQHHRDCDEFFQKEKDWSHVYNMAIKETIDSLNSRISAKNSE